MSPLVLALMAIMNPMFLLFLLVVSLFAFFALRVVTGSAWKAAVGVFAVPALFMLILAGPFARCAVWLPFNPAWLWLVVGMLVAASAGLVAVAWRRRRQGRPACWPLLAAAPLVLYAPVLALCLAHLALPPLAGVVRDVSTGAPLGSATVRMRLYAHGPIGGWESVLPPMPVGEERAVATDAQGRFRFPGWLSLAPTGLLGKPSGLTHADLILIHADGYFAWVVWLDPPRGEIASGPRSTVDMSPWAEATIRRVGAHAPDVTLSLRPLDRPRTDTMAANGDPVAVGLGAIATAADSATIEGRTFVTSGELAALAEALAGRSALTDAAARSLRRAAGELCVRETFGAEPPGLGCTSLEKTLVTYCAAHPHADSCRR